MKRALYCAILLPLIALAGSKDDFLKARTVWNDGQDLGNTAPVYAAPRVAPKGSGGGTDVVGRIDTVGGTTYDWQVNGPCDQYICVDSTYGVHVTWMFSAQSSGYTDRNMRYNFYDFTAGAWNFIDPTNFMNGGVNVFTLRSGFGMLDVDPVTGCAYICCHQAPSGISPTVARDVAPGAGIFTECPGTPNAAGGYPSMNLTQSEKVHVALSDASTDSIEYSGIEPWCTWSTPVALVGGTPPCIIRGSKTSGKVVVAWVQENSSGPDTGWYRQSTDDGVTWDPAVQIPSPPAFTPGSDSIATFYSICPFLDDNDSLHVVATVGWATGGMAGAYITPTEIWHWYQPTGTWGEVARWGPDTATYVNNGHSVGYNSLFAGRPTLCQSGPNEFECVWEGFDSLNFESTTGCLRSEIFAAGSGDNGATWGPYCQLTDPDSTSKRFPSVAAHTWRDTCFVRYEDDLVAGFGISPYGQGPVTNNPIIVQRFVLIPTTSVSGGGTRSPAVLALALNPNPVRMNSTISYDLPKSGAVRLLLCDATGRTVRVLVNEPKDPGRYSVGWDGRSDSGVLLPAGIYFCRLEAGTECLTRKLVIVS